ncbi:glycoside hydrolase family 38 C-terminal domain-containing protein [Microbispora sp. NBRC 16548]|uniref:glycoside hydrolase family 38 N-terminal domain-containing protein n=1 Tax=Microbispora sp. NBRC 16548 TaxID=3030994 RepID=UPI002552A4ED|nr:glycoside hydrolase family 38 C-terminal domain-containing protein [Microbispora sp. NBRC 16548]
MVVPHTHWDREWYLPFQRFRVGLVRVLDEVLDAMAADPAYRFTMDGQLAAIEDYLEIRPARRGDVARFVAEGRLAVGPWLILADEFLCSGETLLRNLEYGMRGAAALGGAMPVGYLPDQFGHCAQMPQMLALAGLRLACLWRGVPAHVDRDAFDWTGADGTTIRTGYLPGGYGNAFGLFTGPAEGMPDRVTAFVSTAKGWAAGDTLLAMYGADHSAPAREITASGLRVATLAEALTGDPADGEVPRVAGELRSHARANILPGVISARVPLKQAMARAERILTRYAEPLSALWLADRSAGERLIDMAWRSVIACSGHDSVTGCGSDETAQQVAARIAEAGQTAQAVVDLVAASLAEAAPKGALVVVNPSPFERTGLVLADLPEDRASLADASGRAVPVQRLEHAPTLLDETVMDDLSRLLGRVHERELYGHEIVSWHAGDGVFTVTVSRHASGAYAYEDLRRAVLEAGPGPWVVRTVAEPVVTVAALVTVPPLGRAVLTARPPAPGRTAPVANTPVANTLRTDPYGFEPVLDNGLLRVRVAGDGTLSLRGAGGTEVHGVGRIVHGGDAGDTYNHAPPPHDRLLDRPSRVVVEEVCAGPLTGAYEITRVYDWPAGLGDAAGSDAAETVPTAVTTRVELRAGEPFARCEITMDVRCRDHRVRWHTPLPRAAAESYAEGQFAVVRRGLAAEGGGGERPIPTFPAESFAAAGGLAVLLDHVTEYEIVRDEIGGDGTEMALTLVRSVGYLSRNRNPYRDEPAGPEVPTPAAQCRGPLAVRFAVLPYAGEWHEAGLPRLAEEFRHDLLAVPGTGANAGDGDGPGGGGRVAISGDGVMMAALRERDGRLEVRLVAEHPTATEAVVRGDFTAAWTAGVLGSPLSPLEVSRDEVFPGDGADGQGPARSPGSWRTVRVPLNPFEIATVHLGRA